MSCQGHERTAFGNMAQWLKHWSDDLMVIRLKPSLIAQLFPDTIISVGMLHKAFPKD